MWDIKQKAANELIDMTVWLVVTIREAGRVGEEGAGGQTWDGRRLDFGRWARNALYRDCVTGLWALETYIMLLTDVTPIDLIFKKLLNKKKRDKRPFPHRSSKSPGVDITLALLGLTEDTCPPIPGDRGLCGSCAHVPTS